MILSFTHLITLPILLYLYHLFIIKHTTFTKAESNQLSNIKNIPFSKFVKTSFDIKINRKCIYTQLKKEYEHFYIEEELLNWN